MSMTLWDTLSGKTQLYLEKESASHPGGANDGILPTAPSTPSREIPSRTKSSRAGTGARDGKVHRAVGSRMTTGEGGGQHQGGQPERST